jgi:hypothetical protein
MGNGTKAGDGARRWQQWTERQAYEVLEELAAAGESMASFARRKGISTQRITYWRKRLAITPPKTAFVAVPLSVEASPKRIEIASAGVVVRVREDFDVDRLAQLVEAIGRRTGGPC